MAQSHPPQRISLAEAVSLAQQRLYASPRSRRHPLGREQLQDLLAIALSSNVPVLGVHPGESSPRRVAPELLAQGTFSGGALRLEAPDGGLVTHLQVEMDALERALEGLTTQVASRLIRDRLLERVRRLRARSAARAAGVGEEAP